MLAEKPKLFYSLKSLGFFLIFLFFILVIRVFFSYQDYKEFITKPFYYTTATVLASYEKQVGKKKYMVLKLQSDEGFRFYTTRYQREDLNEHILRLQLFPTSEISFIDYLGTFYVHSMVKKKTSLAKGVKTDLLTAIASQHSHPWMRSFYQAIFFATPVDKGLREEIIKWGVSHLVALSGFHLGILWIVIYTVLLLFYRPFQQKYFPYRYALFDMGIVTLAILLFYLYFVDFPPSLVRAYAMMVFGWVFLLLGVEIISFSFLWSVVFLLLAFFPSLLVSLSFWLSVAGVFYIYLILHYVPQRYKMATTFVFIPLGIFALMLPVVHTVFPLITSYQLYSPLLSLVFIIFYPMMIVLHILGIGNLCDSLLLSLVSLSMPSKEFFVPLDYFIAYAVLSLLAMLHRFVFYFLVLSAFSFTIYLFFIFKGL